MIGFARTGAKVAVLAVVAATALAACGGSSKNTGSSSVGPLGAFGKVPAATGTAHAGTITVAQGPSSSPLWILPIITAADNSVFTVTQFDYEMWRPLYWLVNGVEPTEVPSMSIADEPVWSNSDKTVSITLKSNYKWSDGQPVTSKDVEFWFDETKAGIKVSPANWAYYTPGLGIPDEVASVTTPSTSTVVFNLTKSVNPTWFKENQLGAIQAMPSHAWAKTSASGPTVDFTNPANATAIYNFLASQSKSVGTWASNPLWQTVDGPFKLTSFNSTTGAYTLTPNASYGGPHAAKVSTIMSVPFTSDAAEFNAVKAHNIDVGYVPLPDVPELSGVQSNYNAFGYPDFGWTFVVYNFKDTTGNFNNIIGQLYVRQALAHLENQPGYIKAFFYNAGGPGYGPVPSIPKSPFTPTNALTNPYPFNVSTAVSLLKSHGWTVVPGGTDSCAKPGTAANECGAGIPAGTKLSFNLIYGTNPAVIAEQVTDLASQAKKAGITINLSSSNFNYMISNYNDPAAPKTINKWAMEDFGGETNSTYPTTYGVFNSSGSGNLGGYSSPTADSLITASISSSNPSAVTNEASYLTQNEPSLFQPNPDNAFGTAAIVVWSKNISGNPISFENITQAYLTPEYWYLTK
jgi:peptide/nickel transport system substrate-binding protein